MKPSVVFTVLALVAIACVVLVVMRPDDAPSIDEAAVAENNRGVGLMAQYEYEQARQIFEALALEHPLWADFRVNLAIATLNRQRDGDSETALTLLDEVVAMDGDDMRAQYCSGLLRLYLDSPERALERFRLVAESDPDDAYAAYYTGQCLAQLQRFDEAIEWYERALAVDGYLRSAYYGLSQAYPRVGRVDDAREMLELFGRLKDNPRSRLVEFKYTRMGPKGMAAAVDADEPSRTPLPEGALFGDARPLIDGANWRLVDDRSVSVTASDLDDDGDLDLFLANALDGDASNAVLINDGAGGFTVDAGHPLAAIDHVRAVAWGDFDNDGRTDAYLACRGPNHLFRRADDGRWIDVTESTGTGNGALDTVDTAMFDADHDGDLDLFCVNADGPDELLNNNLDGTFRPLAEERGLAGGDTPSRQVLVADIDGDRDADIVVVKDTPPHVAYINDRTWAYHPADGLSSFLDSPMAAAGAADLDADGRLELIAVATDGAVERHSRGVDGAWEATEIAAGDGVGGKTQRLAIADLDGDGVLDLATGGSDGWRVIDAEGRALFTGDDPLAGWEFVALEPASGPSLVGATAAGPTVRAPGPGRFAFTGLTFSGKEDTGDSMRSNTSGIGVRVVVRMDSQWTITGTHRSGSGPGQSLQPLVVGLAGWPALDFISLDWPDGILQTELQGVPPKPGAPAREFAAGRLERVEELQRQKSSCPVLFAWNGSRHAFVSDLLGVGGLGFAIGPRTYATPRPWERFLMPPDSLAPRDDRFVIKISEPMEEACYLDAVRLVAWDLPPGWQMTLDERMGTGDPAPTGEPWFYRRTSSPTRVVNERDEDVTASVLSRDGVAADVGPLDRRFLGRLAGEHVLTIEFPTPIDASSEGGVPVLVADGWVEYPYSQTMFAAWQAGATYDPPSVEAEAADGTWHVVLDRFGYPAGMPRQTSVPLGELPDGTRRLRIRTTLEVYWDRLAVVWAEACPDARRTALSLESARLGTSGFARRTTGLQRRPAYDYDTRAPLFDTRAQQGAYTRLGPVEELLDATDSAVAIFGPGEEVELAFQAGSPPPAGWGRRYVIEADGWCKDMDLYTRDGDTIEPLPVRPEDVGSRDRQALHEQHNVRLMDE